MDCQKSVQVFWKTVIAGSVCQIWPHLPTPHVTQIDTCLPWQQTPGWLVAKTQEASFTALNFANCRFIASHRCHHLSFARVVRNASFSFHRVPAAMPVCITCSRYWSPIIYLRRSFRPTSPLRRS